MGGAQPSVHRVSPVCQADEGRRVEVAMRGDPYRSPTQVCGPVRAPDLHSGIHGLLFLPAGWDRRQVPLTRNPGFASMVGCSAPCQLLSLPGVRPPSPIPISHISPLLSSDVKADPTQVDTRPNRAPPLRRLLRLAGQCLRLARQLALTGIASPGEAERGQGYRGGFLVQPGRPEEYVSKDRWECPGQVAQLVRTLY